MKSYPIEKVNRLIEPGPIVLVTTFNKGKANIMTMGFHMMVQHDPPLIGAVIGPWDYSYQALKKTGECVIAIPGADLAICLSWLLKKPGATRQEKNNVRSIILAMAVSKQMADQ